MASEDPTKALAHIRNISAPNVKVSRLLLLAGASPDGLSSNHQEGQNLIHRFAANGNMEMIQLLAEFGANLSCPDLQGMTIKY
jgi:ankyrin repeat protein